MHVLDLFFPKFCIGCGKIGTYICKFCQQKVEPIQTRDTICPICEQSTFDGRTHPKCNTRYSLGWDDKLFPLPRSHKKIGKSDKVSIPVRPITNNSIAPTRNSFRYFYLIVHTSRYVHTCDPSSCYAITISRIFKRKR